MIVNQNRGSYGMFSRAGRSSTEKFHIIMKKDEILSGYSKPHKPYDMFASKNDRDLDNELDNLDDSNNYISVEKTNLSKKNTHKKKIKKRKTSLTKFEEIITKNKRMNEVPSFNKYNPKNEYIWKKLVYSQGWDKSKKKNFSIKKKEDVKAKFYIAHDTEGKNIKGKNFVDLARQTERGNFQNIKTAESENDENTNNTTNKRKFFSYDKSASNWHNQVLPNTTSHFFKNRSNMNSQQNSARKTNEMQNNASTYFNNQEELNPYAAPQDIKRETAFSFNTGFKTSYSSFSYFKNSTSQNKKWMKIQAPDFKRMGSRETNTNVRTDKIRIIPFGLPSINAIKESTSN